MLCRLLFAAALLAGEFPGEPARELARKISAKLPPRQGITLELRNLSSLAAEQVTQARSALERELRSRRHALTQKPDNVRVSANLSENVRELVWVAEIRRGEEREVVMATFPRPARGAAGEAASPVMIEKNLLWEQDREILDVAMAGEDLWVLERDGVKYSQKGGETAESIGISAPASWAWPRDLRGRAQIEGRLLRAYFPGMRCTAEMRPSAGMECRESAAPWPVEPGAAMVKGRNFFEVQGLPAFYTAVRTRDRDGTDVLILADVNGRVRVYDERMREVAGWDGWGSEVAAVESGCGGGRQVLAALNRAAGETDAVQAFDISGRKPVAVSPPVEFAGVLTALWSKSADRNALAVSWNLKTGRYAAYNLSVTCTP